MYFVAPKVVINMAPKMKTKMKNKAVSTPNILTSKSGRGPLPYCKIGTELGGLQSVSFPY
jgi:hypothetical protein